MSEKLYKVPDVWKNNAYIDSALYKKMYAQSISDPNKFWGEQAKRIDWIKKPTIIKNASFDPVNIKWFEDGELNVTISCIDRHLATKADQIALIWESDEPNERQRTFSYAQLHLEVNKWANTLKKLGVKKGDRVTIYLPMIPEAAFAMLACARIGAVHSVVFAGFSPDSLAGRINDCQSNIVITSDEGRRGGKKIPLKKNVDAAAKLAPILKTTLVVKHTGSEIEWHEGRDVFWHEISKDISDQCEAEPMNAEEPLFVLYTSGSTGKPKGVVHTSGGYLTYINLAFEVIFDYQQGDIYWCGADLGWITGHSFTLYAPLSNGATTIMYEGVPNYPDASRFWQIIDKYKVTQFFTAPTAIRALMAMGDEYVTKTDRSSLKILATAGEPINPQAWEWYYKIVGNEQCQIIDNYWQTETGGMLLTPLPGATDLKPGSATFPFFG
ncbi:MAG: acetate--CoA ligase, partial [Devosiaceae bacterium]|nr:acetate--CoA ligase [Devosiaceae bacterium]